jgi:predicted RNA-binding Zn ribbon-like protein
MISEVKPADQAWVVAFVNEYGTEPRREANEQLEPYPPLSALGEHDAALAVGLTEAQLVSLADSLHRVFAASSRSKAAQSLNELLEESNPVPRVRSSESAESYEKFWRVRARAASVSPLMASCALTLIDVLGGPWRFGLCEASACADVFVDRSPGRQRRYCSSPCQNRSKVAAFRRRQKQG